MKEVDKIIEARDEAATLSEFLDWLEGRGYQICVWKEFTRHSSEVGDYTQEGFYPRLCSNEQLLADYFEIDLEKVERERVDILRQFRIDYEMAETSTAHHSPPMTDPTNAAPFGCKDCEYAVRRFNGGSGATTCTFLGGERIVSVGVEVPTTRPAECPLEGECENDWVERKELKN